MANPEHFESFEQHFETLEQHLEILDQGVDVWNQWREEHYMIRPYLNGMDFSGEDIHGINLSRAYLSGADFSNANLSNADLCEAHLSRANFSFAHLDGADFSEAVFFYTVLAGVYLNDVSGLDTVIHNGRSSIGIDTIYNSRGKIPAEFLRGVGLPDDFIAYIDSFIVANPLQYYSVFISHSSKDQPFAQRLHADLQAKGVRCWFAPEDMKIGAPILSEIDQAIRVHDKLLLVLSDDSLQSEWVQHEFLSAENQEVHRKSKILFPVRIDNAVMDAEGDWAQRLREQRNIGDFTNWKDHDSYQKAFDRLLRDLQQSAAE